MSTPIKVSELTVLPVITSDDYFPLNDSGSLTTKRATVDALSAFLSGSNIPVGSSSYARFALSASYSKSSSYANFAHSASYAKSSSYALRSSFTTYVTPSEALPANTVNVTGTSSWAASCSNLPTALYQITSAYSKTASFLLHDPNWHVTGVLNGTASYALSASIADYAWSILSGSGISGTGTQNFLTKWNSTGINSPLVDSNVWSDGVMTLYNNTFNTVYYNSIVDGVNTIYSRFGGYGSFCFVGGDLILSGSSPVHKKGESSRLRLLNMDTTDGCFIQLSSSYNSISGLRDGAMIFQTFDGKGELTPWIFRTANDLVSSSSMTNPLINDRMIITPVGVDTFVDVSGSLFAHEYVGVGKLMSRTGIGARLHVSGSVSDTLPLFVTEATDQNTGLNYLGLYVTKLGQVGIGVTQPQTRLETIGSFSSPQYWVKDGANYLQGISGTWIVFNTSDPNGVASRTYLTFNNGILVGASSAPALTQVVTPPVTPPVVPPTTPPTYGGGGGCPAIWQEIETLELGFVPSEKVEKGMHLRAVGGWNLVFNAYNEEADIWRVVIDGENYDVDESHLWLIQKNTWRRVTELKPHDLIMDAHGNYISIDDVYFLKRGLFRHLEVDRKSYILGNKKLVGHNIVEIIVEKL